MSIPRPEYPRPQLVRDDWMNLNGEWDFALDCGRSGRAQRFPTDGKFDQKIIVPFCPESELSGIGRKDFMPAVWYRRTLDLPEKWAGKRVFIRFGACDYDTEVWVNGQSAGRHRGGYSSFGFEITPFLTPGVNTIAVCAEDDTRSPLQPTGKQSQEFDSFACLYTRTTGIWQTVWLEAMDAAFIWSLRITPDLPNNRVFVTATIDGPAEGMRFSAEASMDGTLITAVDAAVSAGLANVVLDIPADAVRPWSPSDPALYDLSLRLHDGTSAIDSVKSYFGLRSLGIRGRALLLNGKPLFQRLILDQGFYPDGVYTAPSDEALKADIEMSQAMGFNGARLHQKVFEERFLYWADKLGYMVWGEMASWGLDLTNPYALERFQTEWLEILHRDYSHPSIVGWCPFNETGANQNYEVLRQIYRVTKQIDRTRPVIDTSGYVHAGLTDVFDVHDYEQDVDAFASHYMDRLPAQDEIYQPEKPVCPRPMQPYFVSEYGGIWWNPGQKDQESWGYGNRPRTEEEYLTRYRGLTETLLRNPDMCAFCYTQLTDVELEVNGLYTYHRQPKFDPQIIHAINSQPAAIEET